MPMRATSNTYFGTAARPSPPQQQQQQQTQQANHGALMRLPSPLCSRSPPASAAASLKSHIVRGCGIVAVLSAGQEHMAEQEVWADQPAYDARMPSSIRLTAALILRNLGAAIAQPEPADVVAARVPDVAVLLKPFEVPDACALASLHHPQSTILEHAVEESPCSPALCACLYSISSVL